MDVYRDAAALEKIENPAALWDALVQKLRARGISQVIYITAQSDPPAQAKVLTTCPTLYEAAPPEADPFLSHCCNSYDITATGPEFLPDYAYLPDAAKSFIATARAEGFLTGFGIPTRLQGADRYGGFNLGTSLDRATFLDTMWPKAEEFRLFCLLMHRRLEELTAPKTDDVPTLVAPALPSALDALSPREAEVIYMLARGLSRKEAAHVCGISLHTVGDYIKTAYRKLGIHNRAEAARLVFGGHSDDVA